MFHWAVANYVIDLWTLVHLFGWLLIAAFLRRRFPRLDRRAIALTCVAGGMAWEILEGQVVEGLLSFREPPLNRWVADPLVNTLGTLGGVAVASGKRAVCEEH